MSLDDRTYLWDVSNYQDRLTKNHFQQAANEGVAGSIILATDGTGFQNYMFSSQLDWARSVGQVAACYHYVRDASISEQIRNLARTAPKDCPVIPDAEDGSGGIGVLNAFISAALNEGWRVPLEYLPRWYWQQIGSPSLAGRGRPLWASWYPDYVQRTKEQGAAMLPGSVWNGYGGNGVAITQFTSSGVAAGYAPLDLDVFRGTRDELAALIYGYGGEDVGNVDSLSPAALQQIRNEVWFAHHPVGYSADTQKVETSQYNANDFLWWVNGNSWTTVTNVGKLQTSLDAALAALAALSSDSDLTVEKATEIIHNEVSASAEQTAKLIASQAIDALRPMLEQALGADNKAQADQIIGEIGQRLSQVVSGAANVQPGAAQPQGEPTQTTDQAGATA